MTISDVFRHVNDRWDDETVALWLTNPNGWLGGKCPVELLKNDPEAVTRALDLALEDFKVSGDRATVVPVLPVGHKQPQAVKIPAEPTDDDIDDVLYGFGFEYFGTNHGVQRLVHITDDSLDDYGRARQVMEETGVELALYDRDYGDWVPLHAGDWVVEPCDGNGDGFIRLSDADFNARYERCD